MNDVREVEEWTVFLNLSNDNNYPDEVFDYVVEKISEDIAFSALAYKDYEYNEIRKDWETLIPEHIENGKIESEVKWVFRSETIEEQTDLSLALIHELLQESEHLKHSHCFNVRDAWVVHRDGQKATVAIVCAKGDFWKMYRKT